MIRQPLVRGELVSIGLMSDKYIQNSPKNDCRVAPYDKREKALRQFLEKAGALDRTEILPVDDPAAHPAIIDPRYEAIIVSIDTQAGADSINIQRKRLGRKKLDVIVIEHVKDERTTVISSTRIRAGEISSSGRYLYGVPK